MRSNSHRQSDCNIPTGRTVGRKLRGALADKEEASCKGVSTMMTDGVWAEISVGNQCLWLYSEHNAQGVLAPVTSEAALRTGALAIRRIYLSNGHLQNRSARRLLFYCCLRRMAITQKLSGRAKPATPQQYVKGKGKRVKERTLPRHN